MTNIKWYIDTDANKQRFPETIVLHFKHECKKSHKRDRREIICNEIP